MKKAWTIVDQGVNGQPFLWKKRAGRQFVMIDIFNPDYSKRCYSVLSYTRNPLSADNLKGNIIGLGCASRRKDWKIAYHRARKLAEQYMKTN